jgi:hypothetical protein
VTTPKPGASSAIAARRAAYVAPSISAARETSARIASASASPGAASSPAAATGSAAAIIAAAFPNLDDSEIAAIVGPLANFTPEAAPAPAPHWHPIAALAHDLELLPVTQLRQLAGVRSKSIRKADLIAMVAAVA